MVDMIALDGTNNLGLLHLKKKKKKFGLERKEHSFPQLVILPFELLTIEICYNIATIQNKTMLFKDV